LKGNTGQQLKEFTSILHDIYEKQQHCLQRLYSPEKASALPAQPRYVMAHIRIHTFNHMRVAFISDITSMPPNEINI